MNHATADRVMDYSSPRVTGSIWTQTLGLLVDAYRDLHAKKLFWITMLLSLLVVVSFAFVGINETGIQIFTWEIPGAWNTNIIPRDTFYMFLFTSLAIPIWLAWAASILALISVGGIFPDMLSGGSIDLYLSKPIGRVRLFLTKYLFGLLFVALQVFVFSAASFLVIGIRGGKWEPRILLAVPLVTLFFSYLYCVCVLLGTLTRSTLAAILLTLLFWGFLFSLNAADESLLTFKLASEYRVDELRRLVAANDGHISRNAALPQDKRGDVSQFEFQRDLQQQKLADAEDTAGKLRMWHNLIVSAKTPVPKTAETVELMGRWVVNPDPLFAVEDESRSRREARRTQRGRPTTRRSDDLEDYLERPQLHRQLDQAKRGRSVAWVVGTSLGFETVVLALTAWIFCRRDF